MAITRRKFIAFAAITVLLSFGLMLMGLLVADLYLHHRAERSAGLNRHGYRGPVAGRKQAGELRVVALGGSTMFGYGVTWEEAIPQVLERQLQAAGRPARVINLAYNAEGAYAFARNLQDFDYLDYDVVVLYEGYNDLPGDLGPNTSVYRRSSAAFRLTGYFPILPLYLSEKAMMIRHGGDLNAGYAAKGGEKVTTVFKPSLAQRTSAGALDAVAAMTETLGNQLGRMSETEAPKLATASKSGCTDPWVNYCDSIQTAVELVLANGKSVVVVSQPRMAGNSREIHARQQAMLAAMMERQYAGNSRVAWVDLSNAVDLTSPDLTFDAMHLKPAGNEVIAQALVAPVLAVGKAAQR